MKKNYSGAMMTILAVVAVLTLAGYAVADRGPGWGRGGMWGNCPGWGSEGGRGPGYGPGMAGLSEEESKKFDQERKAFFEATEDLRNKIYQKDLELRTEMAKDTPDNAKASAFQKEISEMEAQLDQKRLDHMMTMRKINPRAGRGGMMGGYGGMGMGMGRGMGMGPGARGNCW